MIEKIKNQNLMFGFSLMRILLLSPSVGFLTTVTTKTNWMKKDLQLMEKFRPSISLQQIIKIMELYIVKDKMSLDIKKSLVLFKLCQQVSKLSFSLIEELSKCIGNEISITQIIRELNRFKSFY